MLSLIIFVFMMIYLISALFAVFAFIIDVFKWHKREEHVKVVPSAALNESEVINIERRDNERAPGRGDNDSNNGSSDRDSDGDNNNADGNFF
jgi:hypothetical protein